MTGGWHSYPQIESPAPVMALVATPTDVLAAGPGGVARYTRDEGWTLLLNGLSLRSVTALAQGANCLLAGGDGGIARSLDGGRSWRRCQVPEGSGMVTSLALSPRFGEDDSALSGTLGHGILRSTDKGHSWQTSSFGLASPEVLALAWDTGESVIAATAAGLVRSPNGGRAWRAIAPTEGREFVAIAVDHDGGVLAVPETGPPLRSAAGLANWTPLGDLPDDIQISALIGPAGNEILLGTANHGLLRSDDAGNSWSRVSPKSVNCFAANDARVYAGTETGFMESQDGGETWTNLPLPPLHDLRRVHIVDGALLVSGSSSPAVAWGAGDQWVVLPNTPAPLIGFFSAPDGTLFCTSPHGLFQSSDRGASWAAVIQSSRGTFNQMTFGPEGSGWAGITADGALLRTHDVGRTWQRLPSPFGVLPLIALQAVPNPLPQGSAALIAVTYDERQQAAAIWRSEDGAEHWSRGANIRTPWPVAATCTNPPLVTLGNVITVQHPDGEWRQGSVADAGLRRVVSEGSVIVALGTAALWRSDDRGLTWARDESGLPVDQTLDIALDGGTLFALLTAGRVWSHRL